MCNEKNPMQNIIRDMYYIHKNSARINCIVSLSDDVEHCGVFIYSAVI